MNIKLAKSFTISTVFLFNYCCYSSLTYVANTNIMIGTSSTISQNSLCKTINNGGIYNCNNPLTGNYVGLQKIGTEYFWWFELRAYEMPPMLLTESMLSTNLMPNASLANALTLLISNSQLLLGDDLAFSASIAGVFFMVNF